jgi:hypothetical protein
VRVLALAALPLACAVGVTPEEDNGGTANQGGDPVGGTASVSGSSGSATTAGKPSGGSPSGAFGGTSASGGKAGSSGGGNGGTAGSISGGSTSGGSTNGGSGGAGGSGGSGGGSGGGAGCACPKTLTWMDDTSLSWSTGDCLDVAGAKYLYVGMRMQTYANHQCNPTKQETWCTDSGNDYKFMLCN